jgi:hypothetical protein
VSQRPQWPARQEQLEPVLRATALAVAATGLALAIATNIHGAALLAGIVLAQFTAPRSRRHGRGRTAAVA